MKYAVIEVQNYTLFDHESGLDLTDGDAEEDMYLACIGTIYDTQTQAYKAAEKYLKAVQNMILKNEVLDKSWNLFRGPDLYMLGMEKGITDEDGEVRFDDIEESEWIMKLQVVAIPETKDEIPDREDLTCTLDIINEFYGD